MDNLYIRFGKIPENEQSNRKHHFENIGKEDGVSCYHAVEYDNQYLPVIPIPCTEDTLCTMDYCLLEASNGNRPVYLITGDEVGTGFEKEPILKNIEILEDISHLFLGTYEG